MLINFFSSSARRYSIRACAFRFEKYAPASAPAKPSNAITMLLTYSTIADIVIWDFEMGKKNPLANARGPSVRNAWDEVLFSALFHLFIKMLKIHSGFIFFVLNLNIIYMVDWIWWNPERHDSLASCICYRQVAHSDNIHANKSIYARTSGKVRDSDIFDKNIIEHVDINNKIITFFWPICSIMYTFAYRNQLKIICNPL